MVHSREVFSNSRCLLRMLQLRRHRRIVRFAKSLNLRGPRSYSCSSRPVVAHAVYVVVHNPIVVHVVNHRHVHVVHSAVIGKAIPIPAATLISISGIAVAVVDSSVVAHVAAPESTVPTITPANEAPVARCPQRSGIRRIYPCTRHPIETFRTPIPISRSPDISFTWTQRLLIFRQGRGSLLCVLYRLIVVVVVFRIVILVTAVLRRLILILRLFHRRHGIQRGRAAEAGNRKRKRRYQQSSQRKSQYIHLSKYLSTLDA